jgi:hypothetical protein
MQLRPYFRHAIGPTVSANYLERGLAPSKKHLALLGVQQNGVVEPPAEPGLGSTVLFYFLHSVLEPTSYPFGDREKVKSGRNNHNNGNHYSDL